MANDQNLVSFTSDQSHEEAVKNGQKGGRASGRARRERKTMAEIAKQIAAAPPSKKSKEVLKELGIKSSEATNAAVVTASVFRQAAKGSIPAIEKWQQLTEEVKTEEGTYYLPAVHIGKAFVDLNRQIVPNMEYVLQGGRGSLKSSFVGFKIVELIKNYPTVNALVVRKVGNTVKDSVFAQIKWCIDKLDLNEQFDYKVSPFEITYRKTGQKIFFRGADDPGKIKSLKPEMGYIGILWFEEADQYDGDAELRNIQQSALRGGELSWLFLSFNPPKSRTNFMNKHVLEFKPNMVVHSSSYHDSPREWLGDFFINEAEHLKLINPDAYENEYEGVANGAGGLVFENVEARQLTDEEISHFDRIYQGVDWGWYPDQFAFVRMYYSSDEEVLYIFDELYVNKWSNERTAEWIKEQGYDDYPVICDSAEPKSVNDYVGLGIPARGAVKGPGSVEYGFKWLQRRKIVCDPVRCPNTYKELTEYEYEKDKEGNDISGYPDGNDHALSAIRYGMEACMNRRGNKA